MLFDILKMRIYTNEKNEIPLEALCGQRQAEFQTELIPFFGYRGTS